MNRTIRGTYENGQITLEETPQGVKRADVIVTFTEPSIPGRFMRRGMYKKPGRRMSTEEDFLEAKKEFEPKERNE